MCIYFLSGSTTIQNFFMCLPLTKEEICISFSDPDPYRYEYIFFFLEEITFLFNTHEQ